MDSGGIMDINMQIGTCKLSSNSGQGCLPSLHINTFQWSIESTFPQVWVKTMNKLFLPLTIKVNEYCKLKPVRN